MIIKFQIAYLRKIFTFKYCWKKNMMRFIASITKITISLSNVKLILQRNIHYVVKYF